MCSREVDFDLSLELLVLSPPIFVILLLVTSTLYFTIILLFILKSKCIYRGEISNCFLGEITVIRTGDSQFSRRT